MPKTELSRQKKKERLATLKKLYYFIDKKAKEHNNGYAKYEAISLLWAIQELKEKHNIEQF